MVLMADRHTGRFLVTMLLCDFRGKQIFSSNVCLLFQSVRYVCKYVQVTEETDSVENFEQNNRTKNEFEICSRLLHLFLKVHDSRVYTTFLCSASSGHQLKVTAKSELVP